MGYSSPLFFSHVLFLTLTVHSNEGNFLDGKTKSFLVALITSDIQRSAEGNRISESVSESILSEITTTITAKFRLAIINVTTS
jgi:hypothetical protein